MTTEDQALQAVRRVFSGAVKRDQAARLRPLEQAYVAVAFFLTFPDQYFGSWSGLTLKGNFKTRLEELFADGLRTKARPGDIIAASRQAKLHSSTFTGGAKFAPSPEFADLIKRLGRTRAIQDFYREVADGIGREAVIKAGFAKR